MDKNIIKQIYQELQGYLSQTLKPKDSYEITSDKSVWEQYNGSIDILNKNTDDDFGRFKILPEDCNYPSISISSFRQKLGGLIMHLHAKYFFDEPAPLSGSPTTVITQNQQQDQSQNVYIQFLLDIQSGIDKNIDKYDEGTKEKSFLKNLKSQLSTVTNITQLFSLILKIAKNIGLNPEEILKLLNLS